MSAKHLLPPTEALLSLPIAERIQAVRESRWIGYPRARSILASLEDLLDSPTTHRMAGLLIVGESNNGKTRIINQFERSHPRQMCPESERTRIPVLVIQAPPSVDEGRLYTEIIHGMKAPFRAPARIDQRQHLAIRQMEIVGVRLLIIDEFHNALVARIQQRNAFLTAVRYLGNTLRIPIVCAGTKAAFNAVQTDPQLQNRLRPVELPRWQCNDEFRNLLSSFEKMVPLPQPSDLSTPETAKLIYTMTEGTIGEVADLVNRAAVFAIKNDKQRIDKRILQSVGYVPPSRRQRSAS